MQRLCLLLGNEKWAHIFSETDVNKKWENLCTVFQYYFNIACPLVVLYKIINMTNNK